MPEWTSPRIFFGDDALDNFSNIPGTKCFIATDKGIIQAGLLDILTKKLSELGKEWKVFDEVEPDPHESTILKGAEVCKKYAPDLVIGLGGGSSLDTAKTIWFLYEHAEEGKTIDDLNPFVELHMGVKAKCVAIPTTAGTGAEVTWAVVITRIDAKGNQTKLEQPHRQVTPTYAIIDPIFTKGLPPKLTAATAFDAIAHAGEGLISTWRNEMTDCLCIQALEYINMYLPRVYQNGTDMEARNKMAIAATLAGLGFGNGQVMVGHGIGHSLGAVFHIMHGISVGVIIPYVLEYCINAPNNPEPMRILANAAKKLGLSEWKTADPAAAKALVQMIRTLQKKVNFPTKLAEVGISKADFKAGLDRVVKLTNESAATPMTPRNVSNEDTRKLLEYAFEGKSIDF
jgi:alcohol dehydrogenase class IV